MTTFEPSLELKADSKFFSSVDLGFFGVEVDVFPISIFSKSLTESFSLRIVSKRIFACAASTPKRTFACPSVRFPFSNSVCIFGGSVNSLKEFAIELLGLPTLFATSSCV